MKDTLQKLKNLFFAAVPKKWKAAFQLDCAGKNNWRFAVLPFFNILTQLVCYVIYLNIYPAVYPGLPRLDPAGFTAFSVAYIGINAVFAVLFLWMLRMRGQQNYVRRMHVLAIVFLLAYVLLEGIETSLEVEISGNIYRFLATFFVAAFLPVSPRRERIGLLAVYLLVVETGFVGLIRNGAETVAVNAYPQVALGFFLVCAFLILVTYSSSVRTFTLTQSLLEANEKLQYLTVVDPLTALYNRRAFSEYIQRIWEQAKRIDGEVSVMMMDIDYFKQFNDNYGHQKGDDALMAVADYIKSSLKRSTDMAARYGGEEFVALLPHTPQDSAMQIAEGIRKGVEELHIPNNNAGEARYLTLSIGVATAKPLRNDQYETLIKDADDALYAAKDNGRNCVVLLRRNSFDHKIDDAAGDDD